MHLPLVWRDDAYIQTFVQDTVASDALEIVVEGLQSQLSLGRVDTTDAIGSRTLSEGDRV